MTNIDTNTVALGQRRTPEPGTSAAMTPKEREISHVLIDVRRGRVGIVTGVRRVQALLAQEES